MIRTERYQITCYQDRSYGQLYDLESDPDVLDNLWDSPEHEKLKQKLKGRLMNRLMANIAKPDTREADW